MTKTFQLPVVQGKPLFILSAQIGGPLKINICAGLDIDERQITPRKRGTDFLSGQDLNHRNVEIQGAQQIKSLLIRRDRHQKI